MGCWGMGISECDEYLEVYDNFMEEYDNGVECSAITAAILSKYHAEFDDEDGVMHDVYFALAKAEWMCCAQSELVLNRVKEIIESGANIEFYRELEATEYDLKQRERNLDKFLKSLLVPREKPRKRKRSAPPKEKEFPPIAAGDLLAYKYDSGHRVMCILERAEAQKGKEQVTLTIFENVFTSEELKSTDFLSEKMGTIFTVLADDFIGASLIKNVGHIEIAPRKRKYLIGKNVFLPGDKQSFRRGILRPLSVSLGEFLDLCRENSNDAVVALEIGGVYAYQVCGKYRFAAVLDKMQIQDENYVWIATFAKVSESKNIDLDSTDVAYIRIYESEELPNLEGWEMLGKIPTPPRAPGRLFGNTRILGQGTLDFMMPETLVLGASSIGIKNLGELLSFCKENSPLAFSVLSPGECYCFPFCGGYRFVLILDRFFHGGEEKVMVAVLSAKHESPDEDYQSDEISHFGIYSADTLPNTENWTKCGELALSDAVRAYAARFRTATSECIVKFLSVPSYSSGYLTLGRFLEMKLPGK